MAAILADPHPNPSVVVIAVALELHASIGGLSIPIGKARVGQVQLVRVPRTRFGDVGVGPHHRPRGKGDEVGRAGVAHGAVAIGFELDVDEVVVKESEVCTTRPHGKPSPSAPFEEVVGIVHQVHKYDLVGVQEGQPESGVGRVVELLVSHSGEGVDGEVKREVVQVVAGRMAGHLTGEVCRRMGGVHDHHRQGGPSGQVFGTEVDPFYQCAGSAKGQVEQFNADFAVHSAIVGERLRKGGLQVHHPRQEPFKKDQRMVVRRPNVVAPRHVRAHGRQHPCLLTLGEHVGTIGIVHVVLHVVLGVA